MFNKNSWLVFKQIIEKRKADDEIERGPNSPSASPIELKVESVFMRGDPGMKLPLPLVTENQGWQVIHLDGQIKEMNYEQLLPDNENGYYPVIVEVSLKDLNYKQADRVRRHASVFGSTTRELEIVNSVITSFAGETIWNNDLVNWLQDKYPDTFPTGNVANNFLEWVGLGDFDSANVSFEGTSSSGYALFRFKRRHHAGDPPRTGPHSRIWFIPSRPYSRLVTKHEVYTRLLARKEVISTRGEVLHRPLTTSEQATKFCAAPKAVSREDTQGHQAATVVEFRPAFRNGKPLVFFDLNGIKNLLLLEVGPSQDISDRGSFTVVDGELGTKEVLFQKSPAQSKYVFEEEPRELSPKQRELISNNEQISDDTRIDVTIKQFSEPDVYDEAAADLVLLHECRQLLLTACEAIKAKPFGKPQILASLMQHLLLLNEEIEATRKKCA